METAVGRFTSPSEERGRDELHAFSPFFSFFSSSPLLRLGTEAERGPVGFCAAAVGLHPRVWRLGLRGGDGGMPEMVKKKQREASSFHEVSERLGALLFSGGGFLLGKLRPHFIVGG